MKDFLQAIVFIGLFAVLLLPWYVENDFFFPFITGKNFAFRIIVEIAFASWVLLALYEPKYRPRFSWIFAGFGSLLAVMFFANFLGEFPLKSFWSNFERMDGYITLIHVFLYFVVAGSVLTTQKVWNYFLHVSVAMALCVALYGLAQSSGLIEGGRSRVDSRLGNAAYMAVYMLFHIFFLLYFIVRSKITLHQVLYGFVAVILAYTLLLTGTRGTFIGLVGGLVLGVSYVAVFGHRFPQIRKFAVGGLTILTIMILGFIAVKDTPFVEESVALKRIASIDLAEDLEVRSMIWAMALEGVKERPVLGWGQGNFNYIFNKEYNPELWHAESWFDRTHNIFLDWLVAGGVLGLLAYLSLFVAALYYLFWQPLFRKEDDEPTFSVLERGVLIGLFAGYFVHNIVVFDNIISYIFFGAVLALIHSRVATPIEFIQDWHIDYRLVNQFAAPIVILILVPTVYFANAPGLGAAGDIIDALQQSTVDGRLHEFRDALERDSFADQEIVEQLSQNAIGVARNPNLPPEAKQRFVEAAENQLKILVEEKPNDARLHSFFATFYRSVGLLPQAQEQAARARELSPEKQAIIIEQGVIELQMNNLETALDFFKTAYELAEANPQARIMYASALTASGEVAAARELITDKIMPQFATNDYALSVVDQSGDREFLEEMFVARVESRPKNAQDRASLAFLQYEAGEIEAAIATLEAASEAIPEFAGRAQCFIANLEAGNEPGAGC